MQALYLHEIGLPDERIGLLLTLTLLGDAFISLFITLYADRLGRRSMLLLGTVLKMIGAATFACVHGVGACAGRCMHAVLFSKRRSCTGSCARCSK